MFSVNANIYNNNNNNNFKTDCSTGRFIMFSVNTNIFNDNNNNNNLIIITLKLVVLQGVS